MGANGGVIIFHHLPYKAFLQLSYEIGIIFCIFISQIEM